MALEPELAVFRRELPALLGDRANHGLYVLIGDDAVAGLYPTFEAALSAGYDRFGLGTFLVKAVVEYEPPGYFSRNLRCPT